MTQNNGNGNGNGNAGEPHGHQHAQAVVRIVVEFDPQRGQLHYHFDHCDYYQAIGHLENAQQYMFLDMQRALAAHAPRAQEP